jgi:hypothetical protein
MDYLRRQRRYECNGYDIGLIVGNHTMSTLVSHIYRALSCILSSLLHSQSLNPEAAFHGYVLSSPGRGAFQLMRMTCACSAGVSLILSYD